MHVSLTSKLEAFVKAKVEDGLYNNASEVVREALRLMQEMESLRQAKLERLRGAIGRGDEDLAQSRVTTLSDDDELAAFFAKL